MSKPKATWQTAHRYKIVVPIEDENGQTLAWRRIGTAFPMKNGKGLTLRVDRFVNLAALPNGDARGAVISIFPDDISEQDVKEMDDDQQRPPF